ELPGQDGGGNGKRRPRLRRHPEPPPAPRRQPAVPHQARHALATRAAAGGRQLGVNPGAAVALSALGMDRHDLEAQPVVRPDPGRRRARLPRVEPRTRHLERAAQQPYRKGGLLRGDEREPHGFSFAKKAVAFFRMSRSILSVRFSRRSRPSSSRSSVVSAPVGPRPASTSPCRTQLRSAVSVRSSSRATVATDFPLSRTIRTAWALNSFVNARRLRLTMTHPYRTFVRSGVSTKAGQGQPASCSACLHRGICPGCRRDNTKSAREVSGNRDFFPYRGCRRTRLAKKGWRLVLCR